MGLVCRLLEERGIATTYIATGRDLTELVKPPRSLFVNHPMGNNFGRPGDVSMQTDILRTALGLVHGVEQAGTLRDYPSDWGESFQFLPGGNASKTAVSAG